MTGPVVINSGTLAGAPYGAAGLTLNGGSLVATANATLNRPITLGSSGGIVSPASGVTLNLYGVGGSGTLTYNGIGTGTALLEAANTYSGGTVVNYGTLQGNAVSSGARVRHRRPNMYGGTLQLQGALIQNDSNIIAGVGSLTNLVTDGGATLSVNAQTAGYLTTLSFTTGTTNGAITRGGVGDTLIVVPTQGSLNNREVISFTSTNAPAVTGGIVSPYIVVQSARVPTPTPTSARLPAPT